MKASSPESDALAVVIPAYRTQFLAETLRAWAAQTDRRFRVYVADDGSPEDVAAVVAPFRQSLDLVYSRFADNLGRTSLVAHWHRAMALGHEPWVWIFSDDDLVSPDAVASFRRELAREPRTELYRFGCDWIDAEGRLQPTQGTGDYPRSQSWTEHLSAVFRGRRGSYVLMQNIVFAREAWRREGGFAEYPLGMWTDFSSWARMARHSEIRTMATGRVFCRLHGASISSSRLFGGADRSDLIRAAGRMLEDIEALYRGEGRRAPRWAQLQWFGRLLRFGARPLSRAERRGAADVLRAHWPGWPVLREGVFWWHGVRPYLRGWRARFSR